MNPGFAESAVLDETENGSGIRTGKVMVVSHCKEKWESLGRKRPLN